MLSIPQYQQLNQFILLVADERVKLHKSSNIRMFLLSIKMINGYWALNNFGINVWAMHQSSLKTILPLVVKIFYTFLGEVDEIVLVSHRKLYKITKIIKFNANASNIIQRRCRDWTLGFDKWWSKTSGKSVAISKSKISRLSIWNRSLWD